MLKRTASHSATPLKGKIIQSTKLEKGDVLVTASPTKTSLALRAGNLYSSVSHVAIHVGGGYIIEAIPKKGVHIVHVKTLNETNTTAICVLRLKDIDDSVRDRLSDTAIKLLGFPYSKKKIAQFLRPGPSVDYYGHICSDLVAKAYKEVGSDLFDGIHSQDVAPVHFEKCMALEDVTDQILRHNPLPNYTRDLLSPLEQAANRAVFNHQRGYFISSFELEVSILKRVRQQAKQYPSMRRLATLDQISRELEDKYASNLDDAIALDKVASNAVTENLHNASIGYEYFKVYPKTLFSELGMVALPIYIAATSENQLPIINDGYETKVQIDELKILVEEARHGQQWLDAFYSRYIKRISSLQRKCPELDFYDHVHSMISMASETNQRTEDAIKWFAPNDKNVFDLSKYVM